MGKTTIEWTATRNPDGTITAGFTFNPWEGCAKVSAGCANCYAENRNARFGGGTAPNWGKGAPRRRTSEAYWREPLKWNRDAERAGVRAKVFCASLADVFDAEAPDEWRVDLFDLIRQTPHLDWLLLTKRPENIMRHLEVAYCLARDAKNHELRDWLWEWFNKGNAPKNVWLGTSVENQKAADTRIPAVLGIPARVHFLSVEPMLELVELRNYWRDVPTHDNPDGEFGESDCWETWLNGLDWIICGGESGNSARTFEIEWARDLLSQCREADVPFFMKQLGSQTVVDFYSEDDALREWALNHKHTILGDIGVPWEDGDGQPRSGSVIEVHLRDKKGGKMDEWPEDLRVREMPEVAI